MPVGAVAPPLEDLLRVDLDGPTAVYDRRSGGPDPMWTRPGITTDRHSVATRCNNGLAEERSVGATYALAEAGRIGVPRPDTWDARSGYDGRGILAKLGLLRPLAHPDRRVTIFEVLLSAAQSPVTLRRV